MFEGAWFQVGDDQLHLLVETDTTSSAGGADPGPSASVGLANHVALETDDVARALAELTAAGATLIDEAPRRGLFGLEVAFVHPDSVHGVLAEVVSHG